MRSIRETALAFARACAAAKIRYALVGGFAVMAWGQPRMTLDVDALVAVDAKAAASLQDACRNEGLRVSIEDIQSAIAEGSHVTVFDEQSPYHVDAKLARTAFELSEINEAKRITFSDGELVIARPEDTIAFKLVYGSPQDLQDARSILIRQKGVVNLDQLRALAVRLGVEKSLERLLDEAQA